jgi:hypothetical protein
MGLLRLPRMPETKKVPRDEFTPSQVGGVWDLQHPGEGWCRFHGRGGGCPATWARQVAPRHASGLVLPFSAGPGLHRNTAAAARRRDTRGVVLPSQEGGSHSMWRASFTLLGGGPSSLLFWTSSNAGRGWRPARGRARCATLVKAARSPRPCATPTPPLRHAHAAPAPRLRPPDWLSAPRFFSPTFLGLLLLLSCLPVMSLVCSHSPTHHLPLLVSTHTCPPLAVMWRTLISSGRP